MKRDTHTHTHTHTHTYTHIHTVSSLFPSLSLSTTARFLLKKPVVSLASKHHSPLDSCEGNRRVNLLRALFLICRFCSLGEFRSSRIQLANTEGRPEWFFFPCTSLWRNERNTFAQQKCVVSDLPPAGGRRTLSCGVLKFFFFLSSNDLRSAWTWFADVYLPVLWTLIGCFQILLICKI